VLRGSDVTYEGVTQVNGTVANVVYAIGRQSASGVQLLGTGFAVTPHLIAATAHVAGPADGDLCIVSPSIQNLQEYQDTTNTKVNTIAVKIAK
jgi:hypothetical protein